MFDWSSSTLLGSNYKTSSREQQCAGRELVMESSSEVPPLTDLVSALENATLMAKQLPLATDPSQVFHISSSLQNAHTQLGLFLSRIHSSQPQPAENSLSSAVGEGEPMEVGDSEGPRNDHVDEEENNSKTIIAKVEEGLKNCALSNKRRKRPLSPSSVAAVDRGFLNDGYLVGKGLQEAFDPQATRLRALDLVYQFHG